MIKVLLNGIDVVNQPQGIDSLVEEIFLSDSIYGYLYQVGGSLVFWGDDYFTLRTLFDADYCQDVDIDILEFDDSGVIQRTVFKGVIRLSDANWDLIRSTVEVGIIDNSFFAKIDNNKSIPFNLAEAITKNGDAISNYTSYIQSNVDLFSMISKRYFSEEHQETKADPPWDANEVDEVIDMRIPYRYGIFIYDALKIIVDKMTDNTVDFESDYFTYNLTTPGDYETDAFGILMTGHAMRTGSSRLPRISFEELFSDLHRIFNVYFTLERNYTSKPVLRVEPESYFRNNDSGLYFKSVNELKEAIDLSTIYSKVVLGCSTSNNTFPLQAIPLLLQFQEEYGLQGTCNLDNVLDLRLKNIIINTNTINAVLPGISGFNTGNLIVRKYTTSAVVAPGTVIEDTGADFQVKQIGEGFVLKNPFTGEYTYLVGRIDNDTIKIKDAILPITGAGNTKTYEIYAPSPADQYDDSVFLVQLDRTNVSTTRLPAGYLQLDAIDYRAYNFNYSNQKILERHLGGIPQDIIDQLTDGNDVCNIELTTTFADTSATYTSNTVNSLYKRIRLDDVVSDPNSNYSSGIAEGFYTAPQAGYYKVEAEIIVIHNALVYNNNLRFQVELTVVNAAGQPVGQTVTDVFTLAAAATRIVPFDTVFHCEQGDRIEIWIKQPFSEPALLVPPFGYLGWNGDMAILNTLTGDDTFFKVTEVENGGGIYVPSDPSIVRLVKLETNGFTPRNEIESIISNPFDYLNIQYGDNKYTSGYIEKIDRQLLSGETNITLIKRLNGI